MQENLEKPDTKTLCFGHFTCLQKWSIFTRSEKKEKKTLRFVVAESFLSFFASNQNTTRSGKGRASNH